MTMNELPRSQVDALDIDTNYYHAGPPNGQSLVLLHGMSTSGDSFREYMHSLADEYHLIAPDIPGFGFSGNTEPYTIDHLIEWLASLIDKLALEPLILLGHSFGGILASAYALAYPEDISKLILLSPALFVGHTIPPFARRIGESRAVAETGIALSRVLLERQIRTQFYQPEQMADSIWDRRRADYSRARATAAAFNAAAALDITPRLTNLDKPTLVMWGNDDPVLAPSQAVLLEEFIDDIQIQFLENCGHVPMIEQRDEVARISREFIE